MNCVGRWIDRIETFLFETEPNRWRLDKIMRQTSLFSVISFGLGHAKLDKEHKYGCGDEKILFKMTI